MTLLSKMLASKQRYRQHLASLPIEKKLAMLDVMRERTLLLRSAKEVEAKSGSVREESAKYSP